VDGEENEIGKVLIEFLYLVWTSDAIDNNNLPFRLVYFGNASLGHDLRTLLLSKLEHDHANVHPSFLRLVLDTV